MCLDPGISFFHQQLNPRLMSKSIFTGGKEVASSVTHIWYSLWLSEEDFQLVTRTLRELIQASSLEELTGGTMKVTQVQLKRMAEVWSTWLQISSRGGDWITQARCRRLQNVEVRERTEVYLEEIPKEHKKSASEWFCERHSLTKGISKSASSREFYPDWV